MQNLSGRVTALALVAIAVALGVIAFQATRGSICQHNPDQLASAWGVDLSERGKEVWCRIDFSTATDGDTSPSEAIS